MRSSKVESFALSKRAAIGLLCAGNARFSFGGGAAIGTSSEVVVDDGGFALIGASIGTSVGMEVGDVGFVGESD